MNSYHNLFHQSCTSLSCEPCTNIMRRMLLLKFKNGHLDRVKRIWYLSPMRAAKVWASLRIRAVSPEPPLLAHTSNESRGTFRQKARSMAPLNGWACAVKICHDGMLEDTNSLGGAHLNNLIEQLPTYRNACHGYDCKKKMVSMPTTFGS